MKTIKMSCVCKCIALEFQHKQIASAPSSIIGQICLLLRLNLHNPLIEILVVYLHIAINLQQGHLFVQHP